MPIEYQCGNCSAVLRTPDDTAGKKARCPNCSNLVPIPMPNQPQSQMPPSKPTPHNPFGHQQGAAQSSNPFAPVGVPQHRPMRLAPDIGSAKSKLYPPVITTLVLTSLAGIISALGILGGIVEFVDGPGRSSDIFSLAFAVICLLVNLVGIGGCICLLNFKQRGLGIAGLVCSIIGGIYCCFIPSAFAIWGLVAVSDPTVKQFFR